jgi:hypothetical protein
MKQQMKIFFALFVFALTVFSCDEEPLGDMKLTNYIKLSTDKLTYQKTDTIFLSLENRSGFEVNVGMRCNSWLEMSYQEIVDGKWSKNKYFQYMYLRCPTFVDTIQTKSTVLFKLPCNFFESENTFQLLVPCHVSGKDTNISTISNRFKIEK